MRIPFDSVVLASVVAEIAPYVGSVVQGVRQPDQHTVCLQFYRGGTATAEQREAALLLSCDPDFYRVHFVTRRSASPAPLPQFCAALRARVDGSTVISVEQVGADRVLLLQFASAKGSHRLIAELMGKHSNLVLIDEDGRVVSAAKWVGREKSARPVTPRSVYQLPPVMDEGLVQSGSPTTPGRWIDFASSRPDRVSPFFNRLSQAIQTVPDDWTSYISPDQGAYPLDPRPLGFEALPRVSISIALEQHFAKAVSADRLETRRANLVAVLDRVRLARSTAISDLQQVEAFGAHTSDWQRTGELILAYGPSAAAGATSLDVWDYEGNALSIKIDPELDFRENAAIFFEKAKRAKNRAGMVVDQILRLQQDLGDLEGLLARVREAVRIEQLEDLWGVARERRWLSEQSGAKAKVERPYEGHRIRELIGPGGMKVLYGENAEANEYLTLRVARPNDYWLHVRGSTSAHVVIQTTNHPEKVSREHLMFAAKVAVQNSPSKHAGFVPVDYTLKRYVRRPRGSPKGTALYTHEKTLHIES